MAIETNDLLHEEVKKKDVIEETTKNLEDFKDEAPISREEAEKLWKSMSVVLDEMFKHAEALEDAMRETDAYLYPAGQLKWIVNKAIDEWLVNLEDEKQRQILDKIVENFINNYNSLVKKSEETWSYYVDPDAMFSWINKLAPQERKLIKKKWKKIEKKFPENEIKKYSKDARKKID